MLNLTGYLTATSCLKFHDVPTKHRTVKGHNIPTVSSLEVSLRTS